MTDAVTKPSSFLSAIFRPPKQEEGYSLLPIDSGSQTRVRSHHVEIRPAEVTEASDDGPGEDASFQYTRAEERNLVKKLDRLIMPICIALYLGAYLDRGNLGNANAMGLSKDILNDDASGSKYAWIASAFYFSYIVFQIPGTSGPKLVSPPLWIGSVAILWGSAAASQATATGFKSLLLSRLVLGIGEAGFGAAVPLLFSFWYTKKEIGFRLSIFIGSAAAAGVFGGLLAYQIQQVHNPPMGLKNWQVLFLAESLPVIIAGVCCFFILPSRPETSRWLTRHERSIAVFRKQTESSEERRSFNKELFRRAATDYRLYMCFVIYMGVNLGLASLGGFLPAIVATFGYRGAMAQLMTVPPYTAAFIVMTSACFLSDRAGCRGPFVAFFMFLGSCGYLVLLLFPGHNTISYAAIFLVTIGTYTTIPLMLSWVAANAGSESQRIFGLAGLNMFGQCFSILASHLYPSNAAPFYRVGYSLSFGFQFLAGILALWLQHIWAAENHQRDKAFGVVDALEKIDTAVLGDAAPNFRYTI